MPFFHANSDYEDRDTHPLHLSAGDLVEPGSRDQTWPGWIWVTGTNGHDGYVPEEILVDEGGAWRVTEDFDPTVLTIRRGDLLESLRRIHGWHWCRNQSGAEGWVAGYLLRPQEA